MARSDKKLQITRPELRVKLRRATPYIPGTSRAISRKERLGLEKEFESKYGLRIGETDVRRELREQRRLKAGARTYDEKKAIDRKIRYLKKFFGIKKF